MNCSCGSNFTDEFCQKHGAKAGWCKGCDVKSDKLYHATREVDEVKYLLGHKIELLEKQNKILYEALSATRGQWIHSVNKDQCLEALNEFDGHIHVMPSNGKHEEKKTCWCNPVLSYKDTDTNKEVYLHKSDEETKQ